MAFSPRPMPDRESHELRVSDPVAPGTVNCLQLERITEANEVVHGRRRNAESDMKVELLVGRDLESCTGMNEMLRAAVLREFAFVLDKSVPSASDLPVQQEARLSGQIAGGPLRRPQERKHAGRGPILRYRVGPWHLYLGVVAMAGNGSCSSWKAQRHDQRSIETSSCCQNLLFHSQGEVARPGGKGASRVQGFEIIRGAKTQLRSGSEAKTGEAFGKVDAVLSLASCFSKAVLE